MAKEELKNSFDEVYTDELHEIIDKLTSVIKLDIACSELTKYCLKNSRLDVWETSVLMALAESTATFFMSIHASDKLVDKYIAIIKEMISDALKKEKENSEIKED